MKVPSLPLGVYWVNGVSPIFFRPVNSKMDTITPTHYFPEIFLMSILSLVTWVRSQASGGGGGNPCLGGIKHAIPQQAGQCAGVHPDIHDHSHHQLLSQVFGVLQLNFACSFTFSLMGRFYVRLVHRHEYCTKTFFWHIIRSLIICPQNLRSYSTRHQHYVMVCVVRF